MMGEFSPQACRSWLPSYLARLPSPRAADRARRVWRDIRLSAAVGNGVALRRDPHWRPQAAEKHFCGLSLSLSAARIRATSNSAEIRSLLICCSSASDIVGSSSISTSPALTAWPSCTSIARTTPVSNGWISLTRPLGTTLPGANATISTCPTAAQINARQNRTMTVTPIARPIGDGGVSTSQARPAEMRVLPFRGPLAPLERR